MVWLINFAYGAAVLVVASPLVGIAPVDVELAKEALPALSH